MNTFDLFEIMCNVDVSQKLRVSQMFPLENDVFTDIHTTNQLNSFQLYIVHLRASGFEDRGPSLDMATRSKALLHWYMPAHAMIATSSEISSLQKGRLIFLLGVCLYKATF